MTITWRALSLSAALVCFSVLALDAAELPQIRMERGTGQLIVNGQPFLILGGELGNSCAGTAAQADLIVPRLAAMHVNTLLIPVAGNRSRPGRAASISASSIIGSKPRGNTTSTYCFSGLAVGRMRFRVMLPLG